MSIIVPKINVSVAYPLVHIPPDVDIRWLFRAKAYGKDLQKGDRLIQVAGAAWLEIPEEMGKSAWNDWLLCWKSMEILK